MCLEMGSGSAPVDRERLTISVIIPVALDHAPDRALAALERVDFPRGNIEILVVRGNQPSRQRNCAAGRARGELLYFLDNDSEVEPRALLEAEAAFRDPRIAAVGGPVLATQAASTLQRAIHSLFSSPFGVGTVRHRYKRVGTQPRPGNENMLISCNLVVRRAAFEQVGGFDERLFPHEDNELVNRLVEQDFPVLYHPQVVAYRGQRPSLRAYLQQIARDGMGRGRHYALLPRFFDPICLVPVAFVVYLVTVPFVHHPLYAVPLLLHLSASVASSVSAALRTRSVAVGLLLVGLYPLTHVLYGLFFLLGLLTAARPNRAAEAEFSCNIDPVGTRLPGGER